MSRGRFDPQCAATEATPPLERPRREDRALASRSLVTVRAAPRLVELTGLEPATPWLQTRCSPS